MLRIKTKVRVLEVRTKEQAIEISFRIQNKSSHPIAEDGFTRMVINCGVEFLHCTSELL